MTLRLPLDLYERLRLAAFEDRASQTSVVTEALTAHLDRRDLAAKAA